MPNDDKPIIKPVDEAYWVIEGRLLAGCYPGGKRPQDVARLAVYLDPEADLMAGFAAVGEVWGPHPAAVTVLRVGIGRPGALVEIEAVAALPA